jgi:broad specificity phosphatase PhoE
MCWWNSLIPDGNSWFYDAPLSHLGLSQVDELGKFLRKPPKSKDPEFNEVSVLRGDPSAPPSTIVCSSLRRAISTMAGGFRDRLSRHPEDKILIIPSLQEISRNPDTLSITPTHTRVTASWIEQNSKICDFAQIFAKQVDVSLHIGNKPINTNGLKRMNEFCDYVFTLEEDHVIVGGHSIWFRSFFKTFLPYTIDHVSKTKKIVNCGIVSFKLMKASTGEGDKFMIDPQSVKVVHGGF